VIENASKNLWQPSDSGFTLKTVNSMRYGTYLGNEDSP
jgi:hypothetical protein